MRICMITRMQLNDNDNRFMLRAIELGKSARGKTGDNPYVGCVIVKNGILIGEGKTQPPGNPHAEVMAIKNAERGGYAVAGGTLYTTVEPCSFYGRTPPCASTIIEKKITRVVIGIRDPHPNVNGKGVLLLQQTGIQVTEGVCKSEIRAYLKQWLKQYKLTRSSH